MGGDGIYLRDIGGTFADTAINRLLFMLRRLQQQGVMQIDKSYMVYSCVENCTALYIWNN